ncbi:hypothetical protein J5N97_024970 [Dioscorea zingiberensis]|uniref:Pentatricopeptide repeat-containing protein n=1 Tax=Dioscorea zingiberensis TaxID=325984 RepID=A0A9D5C877_9LILI|nr:hypothetical protein J5N97_024970 [Dioscorea zingiberensis]
MMSHGQAKAIHALAIKTRLDSHVYVVNNLLKLYADCRDIFSARMLFDRFPHRDLFTWTILIRGYTKMGFPKEAIQIFSQMVDTGDEPKPDEITLTVVLSACAALGDLELGRELHSYIDNNNHHLKPDDIHIRNALITMYTKCGDVDTAQKLLRKIPLTERNIVTWNSIISGLSSNGEFKKALSQFRRMQRSGVKPDEVTLVAALNACANLGLLDMGLWIHALIISSQTLISINRFIRNALVDMYAKCGSIDRAQRVFAAIRRKDRDVTSSIRFICSSPEGCVPSESLSWRVERVPKGEPLLSVFQSWMGEGLAIHRGDIFHTINRLRKLKMNKRALEVMEWVVRERPYKLRELDYSYLLEFTTKLHGVSHGESLFLRIPHAYQNELLYNNLVMACLDKGLIRLSLAYMRKMRELGFPISPYVYNRLIILHSSSGRQKTIPKILRQMKADGVSPHTSTYNILLKIKSDNHDIEGLSKVFNEMKQLNVKPNEITYGILAIAHAVARLHTVAETYVDAIEKSKTGHNWSTLDVLLLLYGYLGKGKELERTWNFVRDLPHVKSQSFLLVIEAFGRMGWIDRAEEVWSEMTSTRGLKLTKQFNSMMSVYCRHGLITRATDLFKEMVATQCKPNAITYRHLALGCLKAGLVKEALKTMHIGNDQTLSFQVRKSVPWLETSHMLLEGFADIGDLENARKLLEEFKKSKYHRYTFVFNALIRTYVKAKVYDPNLLREMILAGARPDAETYSLVRLIEQYKD